LSVSRRRDRRIIRPVQHFPVLPQGPYPRLAVAPVGYGTMGTRTVVALLLAGLVAIATVIP
jgi:hypothetical protein